MHRFGIGGNTIVKSEPDAGAARGAEKNAKGLIEMMEFSLWKQVRKRLRRRRRSLWLLGSFTLWLAAAAITGTGAFLVTPFAEAASSLPESEKDRNSVIQTLERHDGPLTVKLRSVYICGEAIRNLGRIDARQIVKLLMSHPEWTAVMASDGTTVQLEQQIDDFSEDCRAQAYFGLDKHGYLSLFEGVPKKEKVVKTFFQLDIQYMESALPQQKVDELANGIKVSDIDEYNSVLSTFSDYAVQENEKAMKSAY
ncbi:BofC C-terminal domain-containing protein [Paenibacillus sp. NEAU-GSW1]|uniref:BofC C-terminal domain-containing protein n=1 Tax=Paenibacillus sp. NEAU-GSW1 TaxID=2682486 RepID=UPI0015660502|nr:BofC C-terminal domain-containing protein [Paenibacillus sp. NEAU-GSW1]